MDIIQSFWYSKDKSKNFISVIELACVASYLANGHQFHLYTYQLDDASMQYLDAELKKCKNYHLFSLKNAEEILSKKEIFFDDRGSVGIAAFSDFFRFNLLYKRGGWWVDMDTICLKPLEFQAPYVFASQRNEATYWGGGIMATTCMIKAPKESKFLEELLLEAKEIIHREFYMGLVLPNFSNFTLRGVIANKMIKKMPFWIKKRLFQKRKRIPWGVIGPAFLDAFIAKREEFKQYIVSPSVFCDVDYFRANDFIEKTEFEHQNEVYVAHVWNAMWEMYHLPKNVTYPKESLIEQLKSRYLPREILNQFPLWDCAKNPICVPDSMGGGEVSLPLKVCRYFYRIFKS